MLPFLVRIDYACNDAAHAPGSLSSPTAEPLSWRLSRCSSSFWTVRRCPSAWRRRPVYSDNSEISWHARALRPMLSWNTCTGLATRRRFYRSSTPVMKLMRDMHRDTRGNARKTKITLLPLITTEWILRAFEWHSSIQSSISQFFFLFIYANGRLTVEFYRNVIEYSFIYHE